MSNNISANSLFHFTRSKENLLSILSDSFYPRYSLEENFFLKQGINKGWAVPMVCFCDIPLSQIKNHVKKYGEYAIGLTKEWGKKSGISPILYTHPKSYLTRNFQELYSEIEPDLLNKHATNITKIWDSYVYTSFFIKPYDGYVTNNEKRQKVRFYDEREWRYVPFKRLIQRVMESEGLAPFLSFDEFQSKQLLERCNSEIAHNCGLKFQPKYIKYIIVSKDSEILDIMDKVLSINGDLFSYNELKLLTTRIISLEQIMGDFK